MWLLACTPASLVLGETPDSETPHSEVTQDSGDILESIGPEPEPPEPDADRFFNLDAVHEVEITLDTPQERSLNNDPYTWVEAGITVDGTAYSGGGVRLKGRLGSFRTLDAKAGFKVDLQQFGGGGHIEGIEGFSLGNLVQDMAMVHQVAAFAIYRAMNVPSPRLGYAWVQVNGEDFGLYIVTEEQDDEFLEANYPDPSGNLYDGDYKYYANGSYTLLDFYNEFVELYELDEGVDNGFSDLHGVVDALDAGQDLGTVVDIDALARDWAVDAWIAHWDSYSYNWNNYRVYFDPTDGKAEILPWDTDQPFYDSLDIAHPSGRLASTCKATPACHDRFLEQISLIGQVVADNGIKAEVQKAIDLIDPYIVEDPRREQSTRTIYQYQDHLLGWLDNRQDYIDSLPGL